MSEVESLRIHGGMTPEGIATGGPALDAMEAANSGRRALERLQRSPNDAAALRDLERSLAALEDAARAAPGVAAQYDALIAELRSALPAQLAPPTTRRTSSARQALQALRRGHPQRAARILIGGRDASSLRRLNVAPEELEARLRSAGFRDGDIQDVREALEAEIGRRFQRLVRADGLRIVQRLERQLDRASAGDPRTLQQVEDELFSARGPELIQRMHLAGAEDEARALDRAMMRGEREGVRPHLQRALATMLPIVREQLERIRGGEEGVADAWGSAYRAFRTSVARVARSLGMDASPTAATKNASVLERAIRRSVVETEAHHQDAVDAARAVFDFAMGVTGYGFVSGLRSVGERAITSREARRRAVAGNASSAQAREAHTDEVVGAARDIGEGALGSLVKGILQELIAEVGGPEALAGGIEALGDRIYERLLRMDLPFRIPERETVHWLVERAVKKLIGEAADVPERVLERAARSGSPES